MSIFSHIWKELKLILACFNPARAEREKGIRQIGTGKTWSLLGGLGNTGTVKGGTMNFSPKMVPPSGRLARRGIISRQQFTLPVIPLEPKAGEAKIFQDTSTLLSDKLRWRVREDAQEHDRVNCHILKARESRFPV